MKILRIICVLAVMALTACTGEPPAATPTAFTTPTPTATPTEEPEPTPTLVPDPPTLPIDLSNVGVLTPTLPVSEQTYFGFTYQKPNGNRLAVGLGAVPVLNPVNVELAGRPEWIVGAPLDGNGSVWVVVLTDGTVQGFLALAGTITPVRISPGQLPAGMPPMLVLHRGAPYLLTAPEGDASPLTHPIVIGDDPAHFAYVATNGDLVINDGGEISRLPVDAMPDARILQDPRERLLLVTGPTSRYAHNVLGDALEGSSLTLLETDPLRVVRVISTGTQVVEGTAPLWADLDDNGDWEIVATLSDEEEGARLVIFDEEGNRLAEGPTTGRGYLWRHQLVGAPFEGGPNLILADVLTPHTEGMLEFFRWDPAQELTVVSSVAGFSSHLLGSRNMDRSLAGDLDGDGFIELLVPTQDQTALAAVRFQGGLASIAWTVNLGAALTTNIAAVTLLDGSMTVGIGLDSELLRLWLP